MTLTTTESDDGLAVDGQTAAAAEAEYFRVETPSGASIRIASTLVDRLEQEVRKTARGGDQLGGILLGRLLASERCTVIEDYQTVARRAHSERLYETETEWAELQRALAIWGSDPQGSIRGIGIFRTHAQTAPEPGSGDRALVHRCLPEPGSVLLVLGSGQNGTLRAAGCVTERQSARGRNCVRFPWNRAELAGRREVRGSRSGRKGLRVLAALAILAGVALLGAGLAGYLARLPQTVEGPPRVTPIPAPALAASVRDAATGPGVGGTDSEPVFQERPTPSAGREERPVPAGGAKPSMWPTDAPDLVGGAAAVPEDADRMLNALSGASAVTAPAEPAAEAQATSLPRAESTPVALRPHVELRKATLDGRPRVPYPPAAAQWRVSGTVRVEAIVRTDGRLRNVRGVAGPPLLLEPTVNAVKEWRYQPAMLDGSPVEEPVTIEVVFRLGKEGQHE